MAGRTLLAGPGAADCFSAAPCVGVACWPRVIPLAKRQDPAHASKTRMRCLSCAVVVLIPPRSPLSLARCLVGRYRRLWIAPARSRFPKIRVSPITGETVPMCTDMGPRFAYDSARGGKAIWTTTPPLRTQEQETVYELPGNRPYASTDGRRRHSAVVCRHRDLGVRQQAQDTKIASTVWQRGI